MVSSGVQPTAMPYRAIQYPCALLMVSLVPKEMPRISAMIVLSSEHNGRYRGGIKLVNIEDGENEEHDSDYM